MNNYELSSARKLLGLSVEEASTHIGRVSQRSWQYWEKAERKIPDDVIQQIQFLLNRRREIINNFKTVIENASKIAVIFYENPEYCNSIVEWRFSQSIASTLAFDYGAKLVKFDYENYSDFLKKSNLKDSQATRSQWATTKI